MSPPIKVLIVDDSAFTRKVLREILEGAADIEVVGIARDGLEALEKIAALKPDVLTLDLVMPNLDGIGVLRALPRTPSSPRVVVVSISDADTDLGAEALQLGAVDLMRKPTALATSRLYELSSTLVEKVRTAALARRVELPEPRPPVPSGMLGHMTRDLVVIGTSTGGPQAITRLLSTLPANFPVPIAIALHIPAGYTDALALRLDASCEITVCEASEGLELRPGVAALAQGGSHLRIVRGLTGPITRIDTLDHGTLYTPSVDLLFKSASEYGSRVLGVVLTGMGNDGLEGARAIDAAGGAILTEAESSCVVYGMPRSIREAGLSKAEAPLDQMAALILRHLAT